MERRRRRLRGILLGCATVVAGCLVVLAALLAYEPAFPAAQLDDATLERAAARLVTKGSALYAAIRRPGPWEAVVTDTEINAWLATDLPRNHPRLLPRGVTSPRVRFGPQRLVAAARMGFGWLSAPVRIDVGVQLRGINQLTLVLHDARIGAIPLPRPLILQEIARRLAALGVAGDLRRPDGRMVLVVSLPSTYDADAMSCWLESLRLDDGEAILAGTTREGSRAEPDEAGNTDSQK
jgi:hypothetical protein